MTIPPLAFAPWGFEVPLPVIMLGIIIGLTYGLLAVGLVLVFRTNRIINFAHGEVGAFGAAVFGIAVTRWHVPYYAAVPIGFGVAGAMAGLAEVAVVRRLRKAPRLMSIVATLGVGQFLVFFSSAVNAQARSGYLYPQPPGLPVFDLGALRITQAYSGMLIFAPLVVVGLVLFLRRSRYGLAIRGSAANPEAARMSGVFAARMSTLAWMIAGALSALTAILIAPSRGFVSGETFGPGLLLRALVGAVIARMTNLPVALAAGIGIGVVEQMLLWNFPQSGFVEVALFVVILGGLLVQRSLAGREEEKGSWAAVQPWRPLPEAIARLWTVRNLGRIIGVAGLALALVLPLLMTNSASVSFVGIMGFTIVGLSVGILTGLGGQLSLGQFAVAAIGAVVSYHVYSRGANIGLAFLYAGIAAAIASLVVGLPALRIRGLMLTVTTLGFALVTPAWLLQQPWALADGVEPGRPVIAGAELDTGKKYYYFMLAILLIVLWLARNVRRGGFGRLLVAIRDNEDNARAFTVRASAVKVQGFLLAGFIAGIGGAAYGHLLSRISTTSFPTGTSILIVAMTVIGGIGILAGPLLGALYIFALPEFVPLDSAGLAATQLGWLLLILYAPGGIAQLLQPVRDRIVRRIARRHGIEVESVDEFAPALVAAGPTPSPTATPTTADFQRTGSLPRFELNGSRSLGISDVILEGIDLRKQFGGVKAVDGVSLAVRSGETVGVIGPNGAGKTTLFELLGGFTRPDTGRVIFDETEVSWLGPEQRGRLGLIRSFQDAALFPTMTVLETVRLALERVLPTSFFASALGIRGNEGRKDAAARELVSFMGLDQYRNKQIQELSTGTRRITELTCLLALRPRLLLLDEPSSGIAQRETEALGVLLDDLKRQLDTTLVIIEHDIPLIMGLANRIIAMDGGKVIATGTPEVVRTDPVVVESYLGGSLEAIQRSGATVS